MALITDVNMTVEVLTRDVAIPNFTTPTGRKYSIAPSDIVPGTYKVVSEVGDLPAELSGAFTGRMRAERAIHNYLVALWNYSDHKAEKKKVSA